MNIKSKKGVTLVEVVIVVAIMAIIMVPISLVFTTAYTNFVGESDKVTAQQSAREILYGKGLKSYGIMGDLERSNATSDLIKISDVTDVSKPDAGQCISIEDDTGAIKIYKYAKDASNVWRLFYQNIDYFQNDRSSNGKEIVVKAFVVEKLKKGKILDATTGIETGTDLIKTTVTVECGKSGDITLQSSYSIPNYEK